MPKQLPATTPDTPAWAAQLSLKERIFVENFAIDLSGTDAAIRSGFSKNRHSAASIASRMRKRPAVAAAISFLVTERTGGTAAAVLNELGAIAFSDIFDIVRIESGRLVVNDIDKLTKEQRAAVSEISEVANDDGTVSFRLKLHDKLSALDKIGKSIGLFKERPAAPAGYDGDAVESVRDSIMERLNQLRRNMDAEAARRGEPEIQPPFKRIEPPPAAQAGPLTIDHE